MSKEKCYLGKQVRIVHNAECATVFSECLISTTRWFCHTNQVLENVQETCPCAWKVHARERDRSMSL
jgi:hypothetical protein